MRRSGVAAPRPTQMIKFLQAQVPELIGGEVQVDEGDLLAWLHPLYGVIELEDEAPMK